MRTPMHRHLVASLLLAGLAGTGCEKDPTCALADAGGVDAGADASVAVDAGPGPLRRLTTRRLFADGPVDNRFKDPVFAAVDGSSWSPFDYYSYRPADVARLHFRTPGGLPALRIARAASQSRAVVNAMVKTPPTEQTVSLWFGHPSAATPPPPSIRLLGLFADGPSAVELEPDPDVEPVILDLVTWTRYQAVISEGPLGWSNLTVTHTSPEVGYLTSPVLVPGRPASAKSRLRVARPRPLTPEERANLEGMYRRMREGL